MSKDIDKFVLKLESDTILFSSPLPGSQDVYSTIELVNPTKDRYAFKIRSTDNTLFRIKNPIGVIEPDTVTYKRQKEIPDDEDHYFSIYYIKLDPKKEMTSLTDFWAAHKGKEEGNKIIGINFKFPRIKRAELMDKKDVKEEKEDVMTDKKKYEEMKLELRRKKEKEEKKKNN